MKPGVNNTAGNFIFRSCIWGLTSLLLVACANTKITQSWVEPGYSKNFRNLLVIGISESEQNRRAWESYFVESLKDLNIKAEASYRLIKSNVEIDKQSITSAIKGMDIDGVIITHLVAVDEETVYRPSTGYAYGGAYGGYYHGGYYNGLYNYYPHVSGYVHSPGYYTTHDTYTLETSLYEVASEELVWTARSRSFSPESIDEVIVDLTKLVVNDLQDKRLLASDNTPE